MHTDTNVHWEIHSYTHKPQNVNKYTN